MLFRSRKYDDDYDNGSLGKMGYQAQEFDDESGELISSDEDEFDDDEFEDEAEDFEVEDEFE